MKWKGTFTIEASLLLPMILFAMAKSISIGVTLHGEVRETSIKACRVCSFQAMELINKERLLGEVFHGGD